MNKKLLIVIVILVLAGIGGYFLLTQQKEKSDLVSKDAVLSKEFKILHVMSYHTPWNWTEDQLRGFKEPLQDLNIEYKVYEMDTKRKSGEEWKLQAGQEAKALIESFRPDLVYTNDDIAQKYVVKDYVNTAIPFVFSGVNSDPATYGFAGSKNVTGVLEQPHFVQTVQLLKQIVPGVKKIAVIYDDDPTWEGVTQLMKGQLNQLPEVEFTSWEKISTFDQYQQAVLKHQEDVDALALLGVHTFKDSQGKNVPWQDVLKWTAENSSLPDFSFWRDRIDYGTLAAVAVSGYEQGLAAGELARQILAGGVSPSDLSMEPTLKGKPAISLARAKKLGIGVKSGLLLSVEAVDKFAWEK